MVYGKSPIGLGNSSKSYLDYIKRNSPTFRPKKNSSGKTYNRKQKRLYAKIMSGIQVQRTLNNDVRFMTLTSSNEARIQNLNISKDFEILRKRIYRYWRHNYCIKHKLIWKYLPKNQKHTINQALKMKYLCVHTNEGNGVLHVLFTGGYIPHAKLSEMWNDIHLSYEVNIKSLERYKTKRLASYLVRRITHYLTGQTHFIRHSNSFDWIFSKRYTTQQGNKRILTSTQVMKILIKLNGFNEGIRQYKSLLQGRNIIISNNGITFKLYGVPHFDVKTIKQNLMDDYI